MTEHASRSQTTHRWYTCPVFIELTAEARADLRRELAERSVATKETWWGYDTIEVDDPDGNELFFPRPD